MIAAVPFVYERKHNKYMHNKNQKGFSLVELLVVVVIVGIISAIATLGYLRTVGSMRDSMTRTRLFQAAQAQSQFRTGLGRRRYAALPELAATVTPQGKLLSEAVLKLDANNVSQPIDNWILEQTPGTPTDTAYLRNKFDIRIRPANAAGTDKIYCIHEDSVEREGTLAGGCNRTSPAVSR